MVLIASPSALLDPGAVLSQRLTFNSINISEEYSSSLFLIGGLSAVFSNTDTGCAFLARLSGAVSFSGHLVGRDRVSTCPSLRSSSLLTGSASHFHPVTVCGARLSGLKSVLSSSGHLPISPMSLPRAPPRSRLWLAQAEPNPFPEFLPRVSTPSLCLLVIWAPASPHLVEDWRGQMLCSLID